MVELIIVSRLFYLLMRFIRTSYSQKIESAKNVGSAFVKFSEKTEKFTLWNNYILHINTLDCCNRL